MGLKYSSDPTLLLKDPALPDGELIRGAGNALIVSEKGDARLLEIGGTASAAVIEYVRILRELAPGEHSRKSRSPDSRRGTIRPSARITESGTDLARRQFANQLWRSGSFAALGTADCPGITNV